MKAQVIARRQIELRSQEIEHLSLLVCIIDEQIKSLKSHKKIISLKEYNRLVKEKTLLTMSIEQAMLDLNVWRGKTKKHTVRSKPVLRLVYSAD